MDLDRARLVLVSRAFALAAALCIGATTPAWATPINHEDFVGNDVAFRDVSEDSSTDPAELPLFGSPTVGGNSLDFNNISFSALAGSDGFDLTDGKLTMTIEALGGGFIDEISLSEAGNYSLFSGGALAKASVSAPVYLDILEVDGSSINPVKVRTQMIFSPSGGVFELSTFDWITTAPWTGELTIDVTEALQNAGIDGKATEVSLLLNDLLVAGGGPQTTSLINKTDLNIGVLVVVPEPGTLALLGAGLLGLFLIGDRRRLARRQGPPDSGV